MSRYRGAFKSLENEIVLEQMLLLGERPKDYEECLALIAYILAKERFTKGNLRAALRLLELANAFAKESGFCRYWHEREHLDMRSLLVLTTLTVKGAEAVPEMSPDLLLPGTNEFLNHAHDDGVWLYRRNQDVTNRKHSELKDILGLRNSSQSESILDAGSNALEVNETNAYQLQKYSRKLNNPQRASRANLLLAQYTMNHGTHQVETTRHLFQRSIQLAQQSGDGVLEARAGLSLGRHLIQTGLRSEGRLTRDKAMHLAESKGYKHLFLN